MIKGIKPFRQSKGYCGPACVKMVFGYYSINLSEGRIAKLTKTSRITGCKEKEIVKLAKNRGFKAYFKKNSSIEKLKKFINKRIPIIVDWNSPEEGGHYSVVVGFDKKNIFIADPHFGKIMKHRIGWFKDRWNDSVNGKITLREIIVICK